MLGEASWTDNVMLEGKGAEQATGNQLSSGQYIGRRREEAVRRDARKKERDPTAEQKRKEDSTDCAAARSMKPAAFF